MFTGVCLSTGGCLVPGGGVPGSGGVPAPRGVPVPRGCLVPGGLDPGGCLLPGGGVPALGGLVWGVPGGDPLDGYCCRRYTSHWNAFLFNGVFTLPDTDPVFNLGTDIRPKNGYRYDWGSESR